MGWQFGTVDDFDQVFFDDGTGWQVVAAIHRAIKERAECILHPMRLTDYASDFSGMLWTDREIGAESLKAQLGKFRADIETLLYREVGLYVYGFTVESGASNFWTMEALEADIGMGAFRDLLVRPQDPRCFVWLQECLNRMIYGAVFFAIGGDQNKELTFPDEYAEGYISNFPLPIGSPETSWDVLYNAPHAAFPPGSVITGGPKVGWHQYDPLPPTWYSYRYNSFSGISHHQSLPFPSYAGQITAIRYMISKEVAGTYTGGNVWITMGGGESTEVDAGEPTAIVVGSPSDFVFGGMNAVKITLDTATPSTAPFSGWVGTNPKRRYVLWVPVQGQVFFDMADELSDQT